MMLGNNQLNYAAVKTGMAKGGSAKTTLSSKILAKLSLSAESEPLCGARSWI